MRIKSLPKTPTAAAEDDVILPVLCQPRRTGFFFGGSDETDKKGKRVA